MIEFPKLPEPGTDAKRESAKARLVVRKCRGCEWQGEAIERLGEVNNCLVRPAD